jgi:hypothetical protein
MTNAYIDILADVDMFEENNSSEMVHSQRVILAVKSCYFLW